METWATTAEIYLTNNWYRNIIGLGQNGYKYKKHNLQDKLIYDPTDSDAQYYTSAGFDMMDDENQSIANYGPGRPVDRVVGYNSTQLQQSLYGATHWNGWKDNIKSQHINATSIYLDELFNNW